MNSYTAALLVLQHESDHMAERQTLAEHSETHLVGSHTVTVTVFSDGSAMGHVYNGDGDYVGSTVTAKLCQHRENFARAAVNLHYATWAEAPTTTRR